MRDRKCVARPKGCLLSSRPQQAWPRTPTERLLADMLQGTGAQFLAVLEALSDPHRRTLHCEPAAGDSDDTVADVCAELFFAGLELVAGGGGARQQHAIKHSTEIHPSVAELGPTALLELVANGEHWFLVRGGVGSGGDRGEGRSRGYSVYVMNHLCVADGRSASLTGLVRKGTAISWGKNSPTHARTFVRLRVYWLSLACCLLTLPFAI